jgi:hypothetical protein
MNSSFESDFNKLNSRDLNTDFDTKSINTITNLYYSLDIFILIIIY